MKLLNTFVKNDDDFFAYDPGNLDPQSDVDEDQQNKRIKTAEDDFMGVSKSKKQNKSEDDHMKILNKVCGDVHNILKTAKIGDDEGESVKTRRRLLYSLEEYFNSAQQADSDAEMEAEEGSEESTKKDAKDKGTKLNNERLIDLEAKDKFKKKEDSLLVKALNFVFECGVNSMVGDIIEGMKEYGAKLKGQKMRILLPPDFNVKLAKKGNLYEIMSPMPLSEKLPRSQIDNLLLCREARLSMVKEEEEEDSNELIITK